MLFAIDIGNTSISFGIFDIKTDPVSGIARKNLIFSSDISALASRSSDEYAVIFNQILTLNGLSGDIIDRAAVSSVVPHLTEPVCKAAELLSGNSPYLIAPGIRTGFSIDIYDPATLGTDIVSNVSAALDILQPPLVVFDAGTANTVTFVNSGKSVVGTVISPGIEISLAALTDNAEQIANITLQGANLPWIGKNTCESISSGVVLGNALMVDGFIRNIRENYLDRNKGEKLSLIATGGYSRIITSKTRNKFLIDDNLTICGIASLYIRNIFPEST